MSHNNHNNHNNYYQNNSNNVSQQHQPSSSSSSYGSPTSQQYYNQPQYTTTSPQHQQQSPQGFNQPNYFDNDDQQHNFQHKPNRSQNNNNFPQTPSKPNLSSQQLQYQPNVISTTRLGTPPLKGRSLMSVNGDGDLTPHFSLLMRPDADVDEFQKNIDNSHSILSGGKGYGSGSSGSNQKIIYSPKLGAQNSQNSQNSNSNIYSPNFSPNSSNLPPTSPLPQNKAIQQDMMGKMISQDVLEIPGMQSSHPSTPILGLPLSPDSTTSPRSPLSDDKYTVSMANNQFAMSIGGNSSNRQFGSNLYHHQNKGRVKDHHHQIISPSTLHAARQQQQQQQGNNPEDVAARLNYQIVNNASEKNARVLQPLTLSNDDTKTDTDIDNVNKQHVDGVSSGESNNDNNDEDSKSGHVSSTSQSDSTPVQDTTTGIDLTGYRHPVTIRGICKAQSLVRGYLARSRARKELMLQAWKELDTKEEQELTISNQQLQSLRTMVDVDNAQVMQRSLREQLKEKATELQNSENNQNGSPLIKALTGNDDIDHDDVGMMGPIGEKDIGGERRGQEIGKNEQILRKSSSPSPTKASQLSEPSSQITPNDNNNNNNNNNNDDHRPVVVDDENDHTTANPQQVSLSRPALSIASSQASHISRGTVENGLYRPASGISFGIDDLQDATVSLADLQVPTGAATKRSTFSIAGKDEDSDWVEKVQTRMKQLRVLREFREHAVPHPSSSSLTSNQDISIDWNAIDNITQEDQEFYYAKAPKFRNRLGTSYRINKSIIDTFPRANLPLLTATRQIDLEWVHALKDELADGRIPIAPIVERLILVTFSILCKEPNVQEVTVPLNGKVTVVGDIHGQLADLFSIFRLNGHPAASNVYVFNGDWVDRGSQSIEVLVLLLAWKALYPKYVFLNRGNHESSDINSRDGFEKECKDKYGVGIFPLFSELFSAVPIGCCIYGSAQDNNLGGNNHNNNNTDTDQGKAKPAPKPAIFVTHGGIPQKGLTIAQIQKENRFYTIPPTDSIIFNMLWSDPSVYKGTYPSSRGAGYEFGPDVTLDFLRNNRCCMLIRSHECVEQGWQLSHHNMCLTVFSASNYQKSVGNQGGYCIIESSLRPTLVTFYAEASNQLATRSSIRFKKLENSVVQKLMDRIAIHRLDLISHYGRIAQDNLTRAQRGEIVENINTTAALPCSEQIISRQQWADGLRDVLGVNIPFLLFQEQLGLPDRGVLGDERGPINYMAFLTPFTPKNDLFFSINSNTSGDVQAHRPTSPGSSPRIPRASLLVGRMDNKGDSGDSGDDGEFALPNYDDVFDQTESGDNNNNNNNNKKKKKNFQIVHVGEKCIKIHLDSNNQPILTPEVSHAALAQLSQLLYSHRYQVESVFRFLDLDNNGSVSRDEFITGIYNLIVLFRAKVTKMRQEEHPDCEVYANNASLLLDLDWDRNNLTYFADIVDQNGDDEIQYGEFISHFEFEAQKIGKESQFYSALVKKF